MAVWSAAIEPSCKVQHDPVGRHFSCAQQSRGLTGSLGAPPDLTSSKQKKETPRCGSVARWPARGEEKSDGKDDQRFAVDGEMGCRSSNFNWRFSGYPRPAGYERGVTAEAVRRLCDGGHLAEAVEALGILVQTESPVSRTLFYTLLKKCVVEKDLVLGRRMHALTVKRGHHSDTFLCNHVLRMYASHGRLQDAMDVFTVAAKPDAFLWSSIISAHVKHEQDKQAIHLYHEMRRSNVKPDGHLFVAALQACARGADLETGQQVHADILNSGIEPDLYVCSCLVDMYAKCGSLAEAQAVFDGLDERNVVTWNAMIAGYSQKGMGQEALRIYSAMQEEGTVTPNSVTFMCLLQACASVGAPALQKGKQFHRQIREQGHLADVLVANSLVNMYSKCGSLEDAQQVFDGLHHKDVGTWTALLAGYSQHGMGLQALHLYSAMQEDDMAVPNSMTFVCLLQACASVGPPALEKGKQLHIQIKEHGHQADVFVASSLVNMYAKCGSLEDAQIVFDGLLEKNVVTWTAMIAGYSQQGMGQEALGLYSAMQEEGMALPDEVTSACLLQACASVGTAALEEGRNLHAQITEQGQLSDEFVASSLVNMYAKCGSLEDSRKVFNGLARKDVVTWTALIAGYSQQAMGQEALQLYNAMQEEGIAVPNAMTFACLLQACAGVGAPALDKGKHLHTQIRQQGFQADVYVANSLVNMYAKCGSLEDARRVFDGLGHKDVVTWTALLAGYSQEGLGQEALRVYATMQEEGIAVPDAMTFVCLLQACGNVAAFLLGRQLHAQIEEQGLQADLFVAGSLISMYGKCGSTVDAQKVFDALHTRDVVTWSALIAGYTSQGDHEVVFELLKRMREDGIQPIGITFCSVLTVCSHSGLVNQGKEYFEDMSRQFGITPTVEHYTCMVDLLGRAGRLDEALDFVTSMPALPSAAVWHTLLGACRKWSNVEVGRAAFAEALKLEERDPATYLLMSSIYTGAQMWEQAQQMQARRVRIQAWKQPGQSWWTDMEGLVHSFVVGEK